MFVLSPESQAINAIMDSAKNIKLTVKHVPLFFRDCFREMPGFEAMYPGDGTCKYVFPAGKNKGVRCSKLCDESKDVWFLRTCTRHSKLKKYYQHRIVFAIHACCYQLGFLEQLKKLGSDLPEVYSQTLKLNAMSTNLRPRLIKEYDESKRASKPTSAPDEEVKEPDAKKPKVE